MATNRHRHGIGIGLAYFAAVTCYGQCPGDTNGDGVRDNADIYSYVEAFVAADPAADLTGDAILDNADILAFVADFLGECHMATAAEIKKEASWNATTSGNAAVWKAGSDLTMALLESDSLLHTAAPASSVQGWSNGGWACFANWSPTAWWGSNVRLFKDQSRTIPAFDPFTVTFNPDTSDWGTPPVVTEVTNPQTGSVTVGPGGHLQITGGASGAGVDANYVIARFVVDSSKIPADFQAALDLTIVYRRNIASGARLFVRSKRGADAFASQQVQGGIADHNVFVVKDSVPIAAGSGDITIELYQDDADGDLTTKTFWLKDLILTVAGASNGLLTLVQGIGSTDTNEWGAEHTGGGNTTGIVTTTILQEYIDDIADVLAPDECIIAAALGQNDTNVQATLEGYWSTKADRDAAAITAASAFTAARLAFIGTHGTITKGATFHDMISEVLAIEALAQQGAGVTGVQVASLYRYYNNTLFADGASIIHAGQDVHYSEAGAEAVQGVTWTLLTTDYQLGGQRSRNRSRLR